MGIISIIPAAAWAVETADIEAAANIMAATNKGAGPVDNRVRRLLILDMVPFLKPLATSVCTRDRRWPSRK